MTRHRPALLAILAALLFIQSGAALAHCLRAMAHDPLSVIEICTGEGRKTVDLSDHGAPQEAEATFCPVYHGLPGLAVPAAPVLWQPVRYAVHVEWAPRPAPAPAPRARATPGAPRAPPAQA